MSHLSIKKTVIYITALIAVTVSMSVLARITTSKLPTVVIVTTGGTIAERYDPKTHAVIPAISGTDLIKAIPALDKIANIKVVNFSNIDSSQMTPALWLKLSRTVNNILKKPQINGVVITHGTDTMVEGAYFLDLTINTTKPVIFTGAMRNTPCISPDGPANIYNAVLQASSRKHFNWGVTITLNQYINSARDARKTHSNNVQTFNSGVKGYLGYIADNKIIFFHDRSDILHLPLPKKLPKVTLLKTYAGDNGDLIYYAVNSGTKGIVIEGVGAGNVNAKVYKAIKYALQKNIPVVITTRVANGGVFPIYGDPGGGASLKRIGVILGGDLSGPKARILLMLALPQVGHDYKKLNIYFSQV